MKRRVTTMCLALGLAGCGPKGRGTNTPGATRAVRAIGGIEVKHHTVAPGQPHARRYGGPLVQRLLGLERHIHKSLVEQGLRHDTGLSRFARELAQVSPSARDIPPPLVDGLLSWSGLVDPPPRLVIVDVPNDPGCFLGTVDRCREPLESLLSEVQSSRPEGSDVNFGVGVASLEDGTTRLLVALHHKLVRVEPLSVTFDPGQQIAIAGMLAPGRRGAKVEVVDPQEQWFAVPTVSGDDGSFSARVPCDRGPGRYRTEILATGEHGPEVVANFDLYCGVTLPTEVEFFTERVMPNVSPGKVAQANFRALNEARRARGLRPLKWHDGAANLALAHSQDMHDNGFVGHTSPRTGSASDRFRAASIHVSALRENVALGYGPRGIHESLMNSPGHRVNMLASDVTHVGIGVVAGLPEGRDGTRSFFLTQNFFAPSVATSASPKSLRRDLKKAVEARLGDVKADWDRSLDDLAAKLLAAPENDPEVQAILGKRLGKLGYKGARHFRVAGPSTEALAGLEAWRQAKDHALGLAIRVETLPSGGSRLVIVLLLAER